MTKEMQELLEWAMIEKEYAMTYKMPVAYSYGLDLQVMEEIRTMDKVIRRIQEGEKQVPAAFSRAHLTKLQQERGD
jgi:hypothetical protein